MTTPRVYANRSLASGQTVELSEASARHLISALRMRAGDALTVFNGRGGEYAAVIEQLRKRKLLVEIGAFNPVERESPLSLQLVQAISRGNRMDYTIQKAVELGINRIVPVTGIRSTVRLDAERRHTRAAHWHGIIVSACEQCGRNRIPELADVQTLETWLASKPAGTGLILDPLASTGLGSLAPMTEPLTLAAGPEGGWDDDEVRLMLEHGYLAARMGPRILRTETAAVAALGALQARFGDFR